MRWRVDGAAKGSPHIGGPLMTERWRLDQGHLGGLPIGSVVMFERDGDEIRVVRPPSDVVLRMSARTTDQAATGNNLRLTAPALGIDATLTRPDMAARGRRSACHGT